MIKAVGHGHELLVEIDGLDVTRKEIDLAQEFSYWVNDLSEVEVAGGDFVQHRRKEKEVVAIDNRDVDIRRVGERLFEVKRRVHTAETAAEDQNTFCHNASWMRRDAQSFLKLFAGTEHHTTGYECAPNCLWCVGETWKFTAIAAAAGDAPVLGLAALSDGQRQADESRSDGRVLLQPSHPDTEDQRDHGRVH